MCQSGPELPLSKDTHPLALSLCLQSQPRAEVGALPRPGGQWFGHDVVLPCPQTELGLLAGDVDKAPWSLAPNFCPACSFNYLARDRPVAEMCHAGLE